MTRTLPTLAATLAAALFAGCVAQNPAQTGLPRAAAPQAEAATPAAAYPPPQEPLDTTPITPVESAGASQTS